MRQNHHDTDEKSEFPRGQAIVPTFQQRSILGIANCFALWTAAAPETPAMR